MAAVSIGNNRKGFDPHRDRRSFGAFQQRQVAEINHLIRGREVQRLSRTERVGSVVAEKGVNDASSSRVGGHDSGHVFGRVTADRHIENQLWVKCCLCDAGQGNTSYKNKTGCKVFLQHVTFSLVMDVDSRRAFTTAQHNDLK